MDANLNHCLATGRSVTGCLHFVNQKSILPNQSCQINLAKSNLARSTQVPANLARLTNVGLHSSFSTLLVHTHQVPLATHQVPLPNSVHIDPNKIRPEFLIVRDLMSDSMLVGPKFMLVGHEGRTWSQGG